jgi:predicted O-methyltransferase YrrM
MKTSRSAASARRAIGKVHSRSFEPIDTLAPIRPSDRWAKMLNAIIWPQHGIFGRDGKGSYGRREAPAELWPEKGETRDHFIDRCIDQLADGGMGKDKAEDVCAAKWNDSTSRGKKAIGRDWDKRKDVIPSISKTELDPWPVNWLGLHREYLQPGEMEIIVALVRSIKATSMIEFGCRDGRTAKILLHNAPMLERYIGLDVPMSYQPILAHQRSEMVAQPGFFARDDPRFELVIRPRGSLDLKADDLPLVDAAFIDGDHSESVVAHDSDLASAIVKPGGLIIWHDYFNGAVEVQRVLDRLASLGWPIQTIDGTWLAFCRI